MEVGERGGGRPAREGGRRRGSEDIIVDGWEPSVGDFEGVSGGDRSQRGESVACRCWKGPLPGDGLMLLLTYAKTVYAM